MQVIAQSTFIAVHEQPKQVLRDEGTNQYALAGLTRCR